MNVSIGYKARAKDSLGNWVYGYVVQHNSGMVSIESPCGSFYVDPSTLCKLVFTHSSDEFYEKDIVTWFGGDSTAQIIFDKNSFAYVLHWSKMNKEGKATDVFIPLVHGVPLQGTLEEFMDAIRYKVVGNVFDDPHLIKVLPYTEVV